jgi:hypothetical protein
MRGTIVLSIVACSTFTAPLGCSSSSGAGPAVGPAGSSAGSPQEPPTDSAADVEAWLAKGYYQNWHCEKTSSAGTGISPHGAHRICSNDVLSAFSGSGEYPVGSANVKELYDTVGGKIVGHAIEFHVTAGTSGSDWFWYEVLDGSSPIANATGVPLCVGCHSSAGANSMPPGHDFVFSQVRP